MTRSGPLPQDGPTIVEERDGRGTRDSFLEGSIYRGSGPFDLDPDLMVEGVVGGELGWGGRLFSTKQQCGPQSGGVRDYDVCGDWRVP